MKTVLGFIVARPLLYALFMRLILLFSGTAFFTLTWCFFDHLSSISDDDVRGASLGVELLGALIAWALITRRPAVARKHKS